MNSRRMALRAVVVLSGTLPAGANERPSTHSGWVLVIGDSPGRVHPQAEAFGGICAPGQRTKVIGDGYPKTIDFSGGARCTSHSGGPVDVLQEGEATLYQGFRDSWLMEGHEIYGLQSHSTSFGLYERGTKGLRFTNTLRLRLTTPDHKPWGRVPEECDYDTFESVECQLDKSGSVK